MRKIIFSIVGARPHFIKAAPFINAMKKSKYNVFTIHTGQHYDKNMSDVFFSDLDLPKPNINLGIGSGSHAKQTSMVMIKVESLIKKIKPLAIVVYGDTNSTLGAALASAKLYIPLIHVESGVRCNNYKMPEEINRKIIDHISDFLCCPSKNALENLYKEGLEKKAFNIGDFTYDSFVKAKILSKKINLSNLNLNIKAGKYYVSTLHREATTTSAKDLSKILNFFDNLELPTILPLHPRTKTFLKKEGISLKYPGNLKIIEPLSYLQMINLLSKSKMLFTDSGGLQKDAYWSKIPCITLMDETTWVETVEAGWNILTGLNVNKIKKAIKYFEKKKLSTNTKHPEIYGRAGAADRMIKKLGWIY